MTIARNTSHNKGIFYEKIQRSLDEEFVVSVDRHKNIFFRLFPYFTLNNPWLSLENSIIVNFLKKSLSIFFSCKLYFFTQKLNNS